MESTACLLSGGNTFCTGRKNSHLNNLLCAKHLKEYYGLEIYAHCIEKPTSYNFTGWVLKPCDGIIFKRNEVIIPVQSFIDKTYRNKNDANTPALTNKEKTYSMNHVLDKFMRRATDKTQVVKGDRKTFEMLRNLSEVSKNVNLNPNTACELDPVNIGYIRSKMTVSETFIENHANKEHMNGIVLTTDKRMSLMEAQDLSLCLKYFLSRFETSQHIVQDLNSKTLEVDNTSYSCAYIEGIGVVASNDVECSAPLVIFGSSRGVHEVGAASDLGFYAENVIVYPKEVVNQKVSKNMINQQNALRRTIIAGRAY